MLGQNIRSTYQTMNASSGILISIRLYNGLTLFQSACGPNVTPNNEDWVRRKANTGEYVWSVQRCLQYSNITFAVKEFGIPTLLKRRMLEAKGKDPDGIGSEFAAHGGGYPINIEVSLN